MFGRMGTIIILARVVIFPHDLYDFFGRLLFRYGGRGCMNRLRRHFLMRLMGIVHTCKLKVIRNWYVDRGVG